MKPVCSIDFGNSVSLNPGQSSFCSSWQSCRSWLVLQLCQLHHLLVRTGLGDNRRQSCSVSRPSLCLNRNGARRRGRPAAEQRRHLSPVRCFRPRLSAPIACMKSTASPRAEWTRPLPLCLTPLARNAAVVSSPSRANSGELVRVPCCAIAHQTSPKAPP